MNDAGKILVAALDAALAPPTQNPNMMISISAIQSLEKKVGKDRAEKLYADANLDLSDHRERTRHRTLKAQLAILNKELRAQPAGVSVRSVLEKFPTSPPVERAVTPVSSSPPKATHPDRSLMLEAVEQAFPLESIAALERKTVANLWVHLERLCFQSHCRIAGMRPDAELAEVYFRSEKPTGIARTMRADKQERLDELFKTNL